MRLLVILASHEITSSHASNIEDLRDMLQSIPNLTVDWCGISNQDDFHTVEHLVSFRYKIVNTARQITKICDFISMVESELDYDWYMKTRPDIRIIEPFTFDSFSPTAINARARVYRGPKRIKYGMSINGEGRYANVGDCFYDEHEKEIVLDDMMFIFHDTVIRLGAFRPIPIGNAREDHIEWVQSYIWNQRGIGMNVVGLYLENTTHGVFSGDVNMNEDTNLTGDSTGS